MVPSEMRCPCYAIIPNSPYNIPANKRHLFNVVLRLPQHQYNISSMSYVCRDVRWKWHDVKILLSRSFKDD